MQTAISHIGVSVVLCCAGLLATANATAADALPADSDGTPVQRCEAAVTTSIQKSRSVQAKQVQFVASKRPQRPAAAASEPEQGTLQGEGHYQGADGSVAFTYTCSLDSQSQEVSGVILKESGAPAPRTEKPWQADLANLSPEICEAGTATAVREKFPRAVRVALSAKSRQLSAAPNGRTYLHGQGSMERAPGMHTSVFTYRCELDTANGKLLGVQLDMVE